jgi:FtsP/CotA-like multicopper oxidase with cupredoxin domain
MLNYIIRRISRMSVAVALLLACLAGGAFADTVDFYLDVQSFVKTFSDGTAVKMWGYAMCDRTGFTNCQPATVPGPALTTRNDGVSKIIAGDTLNIHLMNSLPLTPDYVEPVSVMIAGQLPVVTVNEPVWTDGTSGARTSLTQRVRSMTHETATGGTATYTWNALRAGTYLYESGTHPSVQVQMGLYGALTVDSGAGEAYPGVAYASEVTLLFSEIDVELHTAVANGTYGTAAYPSMNPRDFEAEYYLINGSPYTSAQPPVFAGTIGTNVLLRMLSAAFDERVPLLQGAYMSVVAEDGNPYTYPKEQYATVLAAGKTKDALVNVAAPKYLPFYDRRMGLTNATNTTGGMLTYLAFAAGAGTNTLLEVTKTGSGTVTSVPGGIDCGTTCSGSFPAGVNVTLVANPVPGSVFTGWTGACTGTGECVLDMAAAADVTATFSNVAAVKLLSPNGGDVLPTNSLYPIQWQAPPRATRFVLHYSLDNGTTWTLIAKNVQGTTYNWRVPKVVKNQKTTLIRVTAIAANSTIVGSDISNAVFTIQVMKLTSPNGGEDWSGFQNITWTTHATKRAVTKVVLEYSTNNGQTWKPITKITGFNPGSYLWTVPNLTGVRPNSKVRVTLKDAKGILARDVSDAIFTLNP